jgi:hypothetical protein
MAFADRLHHHVNTAGKVAAVAHGVPGRQGNLSFCPGRSAIHSGSGGATGTTRLYGGGGRGFMSGSCRAQGGGGAVRVIWPGTTRSFPSTNTGDL